MPWLNNSKLNTQEGIKWYCSVCRHRTQPKYNPEWEADGKPLRWEDKTKYDWYVRCSCCNTDYFTSEYDCPHCGRPIDEDQTPLKITDYKTDQRASYEYGIAGHSWYECHRCKTCGRRFWFTNGDW